MAHSLSAKKRIRQNAKRRAQNRGRKQELKTALRSFTETVAAGDAAKSKEVLRSTIKTIDRIAAKGTIHRNTASRRKSRLQKRVNALAAKA